MMNLIKALIFSTIPWYPTYWIIYKITDTTDWALIITIIITISIFFIAMEKLSHNKAPPTITPNIFDVITNIKDRIELNLEQKKGDLYAQAEEEYNNGEIDKKLWSHALIKAKGKEGLRKVEYMKLRAKQLNRNIK